MQLEAMTTEMGPGTRKEATGATRSSALESWGLMVNKNITDLVASGREDNNTLKAKEESNSEGKATSQHDQIEQHPD